MQEPVELPYFKYFLNNKSHIHYGCIVEKNEVIHRIKDISEFYEVLGYSKALQLDHIEPEVFIWAEYKKESAIKANECLQAIIIEYLNKHSQLFRWKYKSFYDDYAGQCKSKKIRSTTYCLNCRMHPLNSKR